MFRFFPAAEAEIEDADDPGGICVGLYRITLPAEQLLPVQMTGQLFCKLVASIQPVRICMEVVRCEDIGCLLFIN